MVDRKRHAKLTWRNLSARDRAISCAVTGPLFQSSVSSSRHTLALQDQKSRAQESSERGNDRSTRSEHWTPETVRSSDNALRHSDTLHSPRHRAMVDPERGDHE